MPPINWLCAVFAFMTRPPSNAPTKRLTRISPRSASTRTSTNCAPNACMAYRFCFVAWLHAAVGLDEVLPAGAPAVQRSEAGLRSRRRCHPAGAARRGRIPCQASRWSFNARSNSLSRTAWQAASTAGPTLATVIEPPDTGACGKVLSPSSNWTTLDRHAQRIGGDLRHHRIGAGAKVLRADLHQRGTIGANPHLRRCRHAMRGIGAGRHAPANQHIAVAHRARLVAIGATSRTPRPPADSSPAAPCWRMACSRADPSRRNCADGTRADPSAAPPPVRRSPIPARSCRWQDPARAYTSAGWHSSPPVDASPRRSGRRTAFRSRARPARRTRQAWAATSARSRRAASTPAGPRHRRQSAASGWCADDSRWT